MKVAPLHWRDGWTRGEPGDGRPSLVIAFADSRLATLDGPLGDLIDAYPDATVVGCSTAGVITGSTIEDGAVSAVAIEFDRTKVGAAVATVDGAEESRVAGKEIAARLLSPDLRGMIVLSEGLEVNGTELVAGVGDIVDESVVVTGGLAGDGDRFERTWVLAEGEIGSNRVVGIGLYGDAVRIGHGSRGGWDIFGPERVITRASGNVLYELDGRPALDLYVDYLGELAEGLPATGLLFPLSISSPVDGREVVRTILAVDDESRSLTFAGDVPEGATAQLMQAHFDRLVSGAEEAARHARLEGSGDLLALAVSCVGRRLVLGERTEEEVEATLDALPPGTIQSGFYSYGELSPHASGRCDLHNQTMTLTTVGEV